MSSDSLSQQEIDLLFGGAAKPAPAGSGSRSANGEIQIYDFRRPSRISMERQRTLEAMYGRLTKAIESWLVGRVRSQVEVQLLGVEQFSFGEFLLSLTTPCNSFVFDISNSGGEQGVIDFGRDFAFFLVDRLLGGNDRIAVLDRALTPLERMVVRTAAEIVVTQVEEVWEDHVPMDLELTRFETIPDMLQTANREDLMLVANVEVSAEHFRSLILVSLPFTVLEKFFTGSGMRRVSSAPGGAKERAADRVAAEHSLRATELPVAVRFPEIRLQMGELAGLRPGSLWATGLPADSELELLVAGEPRFRVVAGRAGQALAVQIVGKAGERAEAGARRTAGVQMTTAAPSAAGDRPLGHGSEPADLAQPGSVQPDSAQLEVARRDSARMDLEVAYPAGPDAAQTEANTINPTDAGRDQ